METRQFQQVAKALADPRRFEMLQTIAAVPEFACQQLTSCFAVSQATVSHHLKELVTCGLVESRREGQYVFYTARLDVIKAYLAELERRLGVEPDAAAITMDAPRSARRPARRQAVAN